MRQQKNSEITIIKEKLAAGKVAKDKGNEFFKEGKVKEVTKDFGIFRKDLQEDDDQTKKNPLQEDIKKTTSIIYSNLAAIEYTQKALKNDPDNIKALYRRAQAYIGDGNTDKAREDLNKLTEKDPNEPGTQRLWNLLKQKEKQQEEKQRKDFRGMFDRMKKDEEKEKTEKDASNKTSETKQIKSSSKSSHNEKIKLNKGEKSAIEKQLEAKLSENEEPRIVELDD
nr:14583_t:CDS:2 [Entrophospora candida]